MPKTPPALAWRNRLMTSENDEATKPEEHTDTQNNAGSRNGSVANLRQKE